MYVCLYFSSIYMSNSLYLHLSPLYYIYIFPLSFQLYFSLPSAFLALRFRLSLTPTTDSLIPTCLSLPIISVSLPPNLSLSHFFSLSLSLKLSLSHLTLSVYPSHPFTLYICPSLPFTLCSSKKPCCHIWYIQTISSISHSTYPVRPRTTHRLLIDTYLMIQITII